MNNASRVLWKDCINTAEFRNAKPALMIPFGRTPEGTDVIVDVHQIRNLLICGIADSGKTTLASVILNSLVIKNGPETVRCIVIDPKQVEYQS